MIRKFLTATTIGLLGSVGMFFTGCSIQETSAQELNDVQSSISIVHTEKTETSTVTSITTKRILHPSIVTTVTKDFPETSTETSTSTEGTSVSTGESTCATEAERINTVISLSETTNILESTESTSTSATTTTTTETTTIEATEETTETSAAKVTASGTVMLMDCSGTAKNYDWSYFEDDEYFYFPNQENSRFILTKRDYYLICNCVAHEAGSYNIPIQQKALVAEVVMNRVYNAYGGLTEENPNAIYNIITAPKQFSGSGSYANLNGFSYKVINSNGNVELAVCEFLCHYGDEDIFNEGYTGFWGDGRQNHFR